MNDKDIIIKRVEDTDNDFIAYFKSSFLNATFCIIFKDYVFGAVGLNTFSEMIKYKYNDNNIKFVISDSEVKLKNPHLIEQIKTRKKEQKK